MFKVNSLQKGKSKTHHVKPLKLIWEKFSEFYDDKNTIHIDDLPRNHYFNKKNGLTILPYKQASLMSKYDNELKYLSKYLAIIADKFDLKEIDHGDWKKYLKKFEEKFN
jgi:ubiquitin-like domain-containing CTD phosphatase 1